MRSPIQKLHKFFQLEQERGYDNRAVVGGLNRIIPVWQKEAEAAQIPGDLIQHIIKQLTLYPSLDPTQRQVVLEQLLARIDQLPETDEAPLPTSTAPIQQHTPPPPPPPATERPPRRSSPPPASQKTTPGLGLEAPLTVLPGVGQRYAQTLHTLNLYTLQDLLYYFPRRYDDYSQLKTINRINYGEELTLIASVVNTFTRQARGGKMQIVETVVTDGTGSLRISWFNQPWIATRLTPGTQIVVSGKVDIYLGRLVMNNPEWELLETEHLHTNRIVPVYPLTAGVTQRWLRRVMFQTVSHWATRLPDPLPESIRNAARLMPLGTALLQAHFPDSFEQLKAAQHRLAFDEIFLLQLGVLRQKRSWHNHTAQIYSVSDEWLQAQMERLPYALTQAQQRALQDIRNDLRSGHPMNRLLQGDVGSGKTVVAALSAAIVAQSGAQVALLAPTSILAEQHAQSLRRLLCGTENDPNAPFQPEQIRLLLGSTPESEREELRAGLLDGRIRLLIGTHALLEDPIEFQNLQLAIIDEQHRFGVGQRSLLRSKGNNPHLLVMTATPIPRSLALTLYGDLDLSILDEMPPGRQPVKTHVLRPAERESAYQAIRGQLEKGHQAFIVYPLIEQGENEDLRAAVEEHQRLQQEVFHRYQVGLLHGRMKPDEKEAIMNQFHAGQYQILVSTTVIEVGVDVPNATIMLIEGANRFGLAQLHQLRGRVGRSDLPSYCLLIPDRDDNAENERLEAMEKTNDGFVLAQFDLEQRGPGDFLGTRQSGMAELKMANLSDLALIETARQLAHELFEQDPTFSDPNHQPLFEKLRLFWRDGRGDIS
ncbi:MAG: ATP-dependent DNA helicase RecG [Anaerolinea sp.]|nr:ATP-dependent DNA helicase RecG [Anaerolinea sp.]